MARTVRDAKLETRSARARLTPQPAPYWRCLIPSELHLGYRRRRKDAPGSWVVRRYLGLDAGGVGRYRAETLGLADDYQDADGATVLGYADAQRLAHEAASSTEEASSVTTTPLTVRAAIDDYLAFLRAERRSAVDAESRARTHILPALGELRVDALTTDVLVRWRDGLAAELPRARTRPGEPQRYKNAPTSDDQRRGRRATVNRTATVLKAALNRAFEHGRVADDTPWRRLKPYRNVGAARPGWLTVSQAQRLIAAAEASTGFQKLVQGALLTGCRYGELCELRVSDFARGLLTVRRSKSGKARDVRLTEEGVAFFKAICAGRQAEDPMFVRSDGQPWAKSLQGRPMTAACRAAGITLIGFHQLRHTWASLAVMGGVPLLVVARNLGHSDTRMVERHYGHLTESYLDEAIKASAPRFGNGEALE